MDQKGPDQKSSDHHSSGWNLKVRQLLYINSEDNIERWSLDHQHNYIRTDLSKKLFFKRPIMWQRMLSKPDKYGSITQSMGDKYQDSLEDLRTSALKTRAIRGIIELLLIRNLVSLSGERLPEDLIYPIFCDVIGDLAVKMPEKVYRAIIRNRKWPK